MNIAYGSPNCRTIYAVSTSMYSVFISEPLSNLVIVCSLILHSSFFCIWHPESILVLLRKIDILKNNSVIYFRLMLLAQTKLELLPEYAMLVTKIWWTVISGFESVSFVEFLNWNCVLECESEILDESNWEMNM